MALSLRYAARSDVGLMRSGNEDSGYAGPRLLVVADGMGGHAGGEVASSIVVAAIASLDDDDLGGDLLDALSNAVDEADRALNRTIAGDSTLEGMGTTLTALLWSGSRVGLAHIGDSRAYLLRGEALLRLSHDHTYVQTLVDAGRLSAEEAEHHPRRSLLVRALDGKNPVEPDLSVREVRAGDRFCVCSDGLSAVVSEETLIEELATGGPDDAADRLVQLAIRSGGPDNITVIVADVVDADDRPHTAAQVVGAAGDPRISAMAQNVVGTSAAERARQALDGGKQAKATERAAERAAADDDDDRSWRRSRWVKRGLWAGAAALLIAVGIVGFFSWVNSQYYVGVKDGRVTVFRGIDQSVVGLSLSTALDQTEVSVDALPEIDRETVTTRIAAIDRNDAERIADRLRGRAASCDVVSPPLGCPGNPQ